ncbi:hypothetical protein EOB59_29975 [Mesorhizobium sp. M7A.F.Ca.MR.176.00.0.0]|uniref:hypothetical protein n=1 Tax=Mesorhizobium sp. M7A.F.Ca.MR.176.00.0.0 TaxID=2496776 RepID=UPI000FD2DDC6|nr:hypothetical protein [Mesorhizobium sp. M7A.F.Ca.MR.176.00.0.0]RUU86112.1 hypothetical protein EOB59_29975 [Mesorhizobium sp. M7A.F.Ca.MR.176.00.0.0]
MTLQNEKPAALQTRTGIEMSASFPASDDRNISKPARKRQADTPQARWKQANPQAVWAHQALRSALNRGLVIQEPCRVCGALDAEAHHPDYDRPMDVDWLCRLHHRREHKRMRCEAING